MAVFLWGYPEYDLREVGVRMNVMVMMLEVVKVGWGSHCGYPVLLRLAPVWGCFHYMCLSAETVVQMAMFWWGHPKYSLGRMMVMLEVARVGRRSRCNYAVLLVVWRGSDYLSPVTVSLVICHRERRGVFPTPLSFPLPLLSCCRGGTLRSFLFPLDGTAAACRSQILRSESPSVARGLWV